MTSDRSQSSKANRYLRQIRFAPIGEAGQAKISASRVVVVGCGALGSMIAERLARAGVGAIRLVDRDWVELSNLQRQTLFTEADAADARPKAVAAADALQRINSTLEYEAVVEDVTFETIQTIAADCDLILDGTDNFETRFLINDFCIKYRVPWIHGGCLGASGQVMSIVPGQTACYRCLIPELPPKEMLESCDTAGVLGPAVGLIANWQCIEALKILSGNAPAVTGRLMAVDLWSSDCRWITLKPSDMCPTCSLNQFPFLEGQIRTDTTILCGKNAVQLTIPGAAAIDLEHLFERFSAFAQPTKNNFFVRVAVDDMLITIFRGGRTVVEGTTSPSEAKTVISKVLGG